MTNLAPSRRPTGARRLDWLPSWPLAVGTTLFLLLLLTAGGDGLLVDPDTQWHIAIGEWILRHAAMPTVDHHSFTFAGKPWIAKEWLSQVLLALSYRAAGWAGVKLLASAALAATFSLLLGLLLRYLAPLPAAILALAAIALSAPHFLARPHVLAFSLSLLWVAGLVRAAEEKRAPGAKLLPVMTAWANLHAGFTLGLLLVAAFALDAVVSVSDNQRRFQLAKGWGLFGLAALAAACITPYGYEPILVAGHIMTLGDALPLISEWRSPDFSAQYLQGLVLLFALLAALVAGLRLPLVRAMIIGGLIGLYFKHARNAEVFGTFVPLILAPILARQWPALAPSKDRWIATNHPSGRWATAISCLLVTAVAAVALTDRSIKPPSAVAPVAALEFARKAGLTGHVLNDYNFGGFLILEGVPTFIDGRGELFGGQFISQYAHAVALRDVKPLDEFLDEYAIDWTLLRKDRAANRLLDRLPGWRRAYEDEDAAIYVRSKMPRKD